MPVIRMFRGQRIKRTEKLQDGRIRIFFYGQNGQTGEQLIVSAETYAKERQASYVPPAATSAVSSAGSTPAQS